MNKNQYYTMMKRLYEKMGRDEDYYVPGWTTFSEVLLHEESGDPSYCENLARDMRDQLDRYRVDGIVEKGLKRTGFKIPHRVAYDSKVILEQNVFSLEEKETLHRFIGELLSHSEYERGAMNRAFGFMAAINPLRKLYGTHEEDHNFDTLEKTIGSDWLNHCEPDERAYGYEILTYLYLMDWIEKGDHEGWYENPAMKTGLENLLYSRAGNGRCAIFGDWRPWEPCWGLYAAVFEKAAAVYKDGRFKFMAQRIIETWERELKTDTPQHPHDLMGLSFAFRWCDDDVNCEPPSDNRGIIKRNSGLLERMVLRSGWSRKDLFATISLSDRNEHGHSDMLALNGMQARGILLEDNGRESYHQHQHNLLFSVDEPEDFPVPRMREKSGEKQTLRLDFNSSRNYGHFTEDHSLAVKAKHPVGNDIPSLFNYNPRGEWVFFMRWLGIGSYTVRISEIRLVSDRETKIVSNFARDRESWIGLTGVEGNTGVFHFDFSSSPNQNPDQNPRYLGHIFLGELDLERGAYNSLEIDYEMTGQLPEEDFHLICLGGSEGYPRHWYSFELPQNEGKVIIYRDCDEYTHALCQSRRMTRYGRNLERNRELFLQKNSFLWIKDNLVYGDRKSHTSGPLWHINQVLEQGENWVCSRMEQKLLIYFIAKKGAEILLTKWDEDSREGRYNGYTFFQKLNSLSGERVSFDTLLIPLEERDNPKEIAEGIRIIAYGKEESVIEIRGETIQFPR